MSGLEIVLGLIVIVADIYAILQVIRSDADSMRKLIWVLMVALLPALGLIAWVFFGPRANGAGSQEASA